MSEKKAKLNRKQQPRPLYQIIITVLDNGSVNAQGFPMDFNLTNQIMDDGKRAIILHFLKQAREGKLNDQNVIEGSRILVAEKKIVGLN